MTSPARWRAGVRRVWPYAKYVIGLALVALAFYQVTGDKSELTEAGTALHHLGWGWVLLGVAAEAVSYLAFAQLQRILLRAGRTYVALGPMVGITLAANAITNSLPAGSVIAPVYSFRQFRRRGADPAVAGWSVVATFVAAAVTLTVVAAAGLAVAGAEGANLDLVPVIGVVLLLSFAMGAVFVQEGALIWTVTVLLHLSQRLTSWPRGELASHIDRIIKRLTAVRLSPRQVVNALWLGLANWTFDCACLAVSFLAVGAAVPWKGLLLAYGAGQLAANLPITPGGLGVVEGSLTIALVAFGGAATSTVLAVLLYRVISFWLILPTGWGALAWLAWTGRRRPWTVPAAVGDAGNPGSSGAGTGGAAAATGHADGEGSSRAAGR
jgi:uncharacterized protein (TIRG00374 family)